MRRLLLIARREYLSYLKTPGFWISLVVAPLGFGFLAMGGPKALEETAPPPRLAVVDLSHSGVEAAIRPALAGSPPLAQVVAPPPPAQAAASPEQAAQALRPALTAHDGLDLAVVVSGPPDHTRVDLWTRAAQASELKGVIAAAVADHLRQARLAAAGLPAPLLRQVAQSQPEVRSYSPKAEAGQVSVRDEAPSLIAMGLAFVLWMSVVTGAGILLNSVIEEKSGRILEVLMASASIPDILGGKIAGAAALAFTVLAAWAVIGLAMLAHSAPSLLGVVTTALLGRGLVLWFALFFTGGYLMYAAVFAAIGAFCETSREAQTLIGPLMILLSIPLVFLGVAQTRPDAPVIAWLSWAPPFTPFLMIARIAGGLPLWQALGGLMLMAGTTALVVWLCARAFQAGALSSGRLELRKLVAGMIRPA
jgi:ABC-2 type transport system permease protein